MATPPLICNPPSVLSMGMDRCTISLFNGTTVIKGLSLCDFSMDVDDYVSQDVCMAPGETFYLQADSLGLIPYGETSFILIKATYPKGTLIDNRYIRWTYKGETYPMSEIMILTGSPDGTPNTGWDVTPGSETTGSPSFIDGGFVLNNPQSFKINLKIIVAVNIPSSDYVSEAENLGIITEQDGSFIVLEDGSYIIL